MQEPGAVVPHAGICAGGAGKPASLPRTKFIRFYLRNLYSIDVPLRVRPPDVPGEVSYNVSGTHFIDPLR